MAKYTVRKGRRYRATIKLGWAEQIVGNEAIADRLRHAGFAEVRVTGSGRTRYAEALWPKEDATAEVPSQVAAIEEIGVAVASMTELFSWPSVKRRQRQNGKLRRHVRRRRVRPQRRARRRLGVSPNPR